LKRREYPICSLLLQSATESPEFLKFDLYTPPNRRSRTEATESGVSVQKVLL
jgi:hypothetical protein